MNSSLVLVAARRGLASSRRHFSSDCAPAQKLRCIFEEYRQQHYSRETPTRFKKELVKAAQNGTSTGGEGAIKVDMLNQILENIGRPEERLSEEELKTILVDAGANGDRSIPVDTMMKLM